MSKRNKKKRKPRKRGQRVQLEGLPNAQLIQQGEAHFLAGNSKKAIPFLHAALDRNETDEAARALLFRTYIARAAELRGKDLIKEANVLLANAENWMPAPAQMSEAELTTFIAAFPVDKAADLCRCYLKIHALTPSLEKAIAGLLAPGERWELLTVLPEAASLRVHAPAVKAALPRMNQGDWEGALEALQPIPRVSAYSPLRAFCLAMTCFYREDDTGLKRALAMIPAQSPLFALAETLRLSPEALSCLWDRPVFPKEDLEALQAHIRHQRTGPAARLIEKMAGAVFPENPRAAIVEIIQYLRPPVGVHQNGAGLVNGLIKRLAPGAHGALLQAKMDFYRFENPLMDAARYLQVLDTEFPIPREHNQAASLTLAFTVNRIIAEGADIPPLFFFSDGLLQQLGIRSPKQRTLYLIEMLSKAVALDPRNELAYQLISQLPRASREAKRVVEPVLEKMVLEFPDDPKPCLSLARLFHEKNAFRKAEAILEEAKRRAPHDARVIDAHVIGLLISAEKRIRGNKAHLAVDDFEKAQSLCQERMRSLVTAKRLLFLYDLPGQASLFDGHVQPSPQQWQEAVAAAIEALGPFQRLDTLGMLSVDINGARRPGTHGFQKKLKRLFKDAGADIPLLTSREIRTLLIPLDDTFSAVMPHLQRAGVYLTHFPQMLRAVNQKDLPPTVEAMIAEDLLKPVKKELQRRLKHKSARPPALLAFYLLVVKRMSGQRGSGRIEFQALLDGVSREERELIRTAARRLSRYASGPFRMALSTLDFEHLDAPMPFPGFPSFLGMEEGWDEDRASSPDEDQPLAGMSEMMDQLPLLMELFRGGFPSKMAHELGVMVEQVIDDLDLRGAPIPFIRDAREDLKHQTSGPWVFDLIAKLLEGKPANKLSRESWEFLYGKD